MSKQLKYRFKKTLKNAEFVHADLEYHKELLPDANALFQEEVRRVVAGLSPDLQQQVQDALEKKARKEQEELLKKANAKDRESDAEEVPQLTVDSTEPGALEKLDNPEDLVDAASEPRGEAPPNKDRELKKLFHRIAEQSPPDKVQANGFSDREVRRLERIFKKALAAYNNSNWYVLYSIGVSLEISMEEVNEEHIQWVEDDIRHTMGEIAIIANLLAWVWYVASEEEKQGILNLYFGTVFGITL